MKTKNIFLLIIIVIGFIAIVTNSDYKEIVSSSSTVPLVYDGTLKQYVALNINIADNQKHDLIFTATTRSDGTYEYIPQDPQTTVTVQKTSETCVYQTLSQGVYRTIGTAQPSAIAQITFNGDTRTVSLSDTKQNFDYMSFTENSGIMYVKVNGIISKSNCPDASNTFLIKNPFDTKYYLVNKDNLASAVNRCLIPLASYVTCKPSNIKDTLFYNQIDGDIKFDGSVLTVTPRTSLGSLNIDVKADAGVFSFYAEKINQIAKPKIESLACGDVSSGSMGAIAITVSDKDSTGNVITVIPISNEVTFTPASIDKVAGKYYFTMNAKTTDTTKDITIKVTAKACDVGFCNTDTKSFTECKVKPKSVIQTNICGNGICDDWESKNSCPVDCVAVTTCGTNELYSIADDKCVCLSNYERNGSGICEQKDNTLLLYLLIAGFFVAVLFLIFVLATGKKRRRK